jgi:tRNA U34 5-carboxymethylaminomethyl modifying GTPase MnmE/TrmE
MKHQDMQAQIDDLLSNKEEAKPVIVAYGMMNAGKSYLLNMLTGHVEQEFFKTNDIRETVDVARYEGADCVWLDTPGLDADEEDDRRAQQGVQAGDIVLFVHQPQGELEAKELTFLGQLRASLDASAPSNIVVVLSKADKESADKIGQIEQRIAQQCMELLGFAPRIFQVSAKRHCDGSIKHQQVLVAVGGIDALAAHLRELAANVQSVRAQKRLVRIDTLLEQVSEARATARAERARLCAAVTAGFGVYNERIAQLRSFLDESSSAYQRIQG